MSFHDNSLYLDLGRLWECWLRTGLLTREIERVGLGKSGIHLRYQDDEEADEGEGTKGPLPIRIESHPFTTRELPLTPSAVRTLLLSNSKALHLGTLALLCDLDRPQSAAKWASIREFFTLVTENHKTHKLSWREIEGGIQAARERKMPTILRSRPDIGRWHRKQHRARRGGG